MPYCIEFATKRIAPCEKSIRTSLFKLQPCSIDSSRKTRPRGSPTAKRFERSACDFFCCVNLHWIALRCPCSDNEPNAFSTFSFCLVVAWPDGKHRLLESSVGYWFAQRGRKRHNSLAHLRFIRKGGFSPFDAPFRCGRCRLAGASNASPSSRPKPSASGTKETTAGVDVYQSPLDNRTGNILSESESRRWDDQFLQLEAEIKQLSMTTPTYSGFSVEPPYFSRPLSQRPS